MINQLTTQRILSIDALRGITILVMIFVNEVAGVGGIPPWMKHMPADADAMTFVDVVFPSFLFIVGMSIPFAINNRIAKGDNVWQLQIHIIWRTIGLLVLGVFMVNTEGGYNEAAMGMSISLWAFLFYVSAILVWNVYTFKNKAFTYICKAAGVIGLVSLAAIYRAGESGTEYMQPHWWGILGLIGWAYLGSSLLYQLLRGHIAGLFLMVVICTGIYAIGSWSGAEAAGLGWVAILKGHAAHTSIVLSGMILSLVFFDQQKERTSGQRFTQAFVFAAVLFIAGYILRPHYTISKIWATPTWCFYSAGSCCLLFIFLYWLIDMKKQGNWTSFLRPAAANPLLIYILPAILYNLWHILHISFPPEMFRYGVPGIIWCAAYAVLLMWVVKGLNKLKIRLQL